MAESFWKTTFHKNTDNGGQPITFDFTREQLEADDQVVIKKQNAIKEEWRTKIPSGATKLEVNRIKKTTTTATISNPIIDAPLKSAFILNTKSPEYYIKFGYLLEYISNNIIPRIKIGDDHSLNPKMFNIDYDEWNNHMYSLPNQISLDPRVCIVRNSNFVTDGGNTDIFHELRLFREIDNGVS